MRRATRWITDPKVVSLLLGVAVSAVLAGCTGRTTGASQIERQADGTFSAKLNAIGSCDKGSPSKPCTAFTRWREVGTRAWTNGPAVEVGRKLKDVRRSQTATGLAPATRYEYQVCGNEFGDPVVCVGPDFRDTQSTEKFVTGGPSAAGGKAAEQPETPQAQTTASDRADDSQGFDGGGGTSPLVPIGIAVGVAALILGGTWLAARRFNW